MRSSSHVLPLGVLTALLLSQVCSGIKWLSISHAPASLHINQTQHCKLLLGMVSSQAQLCRGNLELMQTIVTAAREVKKTCQKTFSDMRWNCSSIDIPIDAQSIGQTSNEFAGWGLFLYRYKMCVSVLPSGTREAAFVYALSAATISHTIARACTTGDLRQCTYTRARLPLGGCADNLHYGLIMGSKFSDAPMKMKRAGSTPTN
ncbi:hypothetical protein F7725_007347 [Dissostichus mawsoni]|uniref:Protein Wnt n=1 Tax=Dissostichus mawsoni TaxID=36200 RepID=A0A7J5XWJ6_DISMA|nr:hypothetical protein F7725_007347 [Dissostichus mawsoni]